MIVSVCADKGSPGVSTVAVALAVVWPGARVIVECDPSGSDAPFRLRAADGDWLSPEPWLGSLATASRLGSSDAREFAQPTVLGVPVVHGGLSAEHFANLRSLWPQVATSLVATPGTVIADLGRMHAGHAAIPVLRAAAMAVVLGHADTAGLAHLRDQVSAVSQTVGLGAGGLPTVMVLVVSPQRSTRKRRAEVETMLASAGLPCPVVGVLPNDPAGAAALWSGPLTRHLAGAALIRAVRAAVSEILRLRPDLAAQLTTSAAHPQEVTS